MALLRFSALSLLCTQGLAFMGSPLRSRSLSNSRRTARTLAMREDFEFSFDIPQKGITEYGTMEVRLPPLLESSTLEVVRYRLPFGLDAAPDAATGQVVVTKDGKGGEKVGDILRQTTYWRGKQPWLFDVSRNAANFDLVVQALVSKDLTVTDEIVLIFERPV